MKWPILLLPLLVLVFAEDELPLAELCDEEQCKLPECRCSSTDIPGGLPARDTPQFVLLTFDDGVNTVNMPTYRSILYGRRNSNNCPIGVTYFVNHEYTDYTLTNELYNMGFEIALHSISHQTPQDYWRDATYDDMMREFGDQIIQMSHFGSIPRDTIKGIRIPFLQLAGNETYRMMADANLLYDCTWPTISHTDPGLWPYTLHYASIQDCQIPPCPTASVPGPWILPMIAWFDLNNTPCSMVDACFFIPDRENEEEWFKFIVGNFERHYLGNRAPFGFYVHEWFIRAYPAVQRALVRFMDLVNSLNDAYMVNAHEVIEWVQNPVPVNEYARRACRHTVPSPCRQTSCGPVRAEHTENLYYMQVCSACPNVYPWLGNPLGN
ncbi:chitin deacetylase 8-like [Aricia agestis]|uniref:chitin deacetylase 8-like n=1 Tax=Aricia agestis TaxID=91739 RepID=UPI001C2031A7|nr:chitin deacetylase 8-like [Aricia agestis]